MSKILLVDDDPQALDSTRKILEYSGYQVTTASDGEDALEKARPTPGRNTPAFDLVVTDVRMPKLGGLEFLRALSLCGESMPVILMTAFGRVEDAVWAMKLGAVDFLTKPFKRQTLLSSIETALKRVRARNAEGVALGSGGQSGSPSGSTDLLIGHSTSMQGLKDLIRRVSPTHANVLLTGESGTGKELVARCLHQQSPRAKFQMIALNCAAVPEQLIESELFGFEKGAFSGATGAKEGLFEAAHGGTLLLDEIGDMPFPLQAKLLRTLQEGEVRRLGSTASKKIDVRVVAATHKDLKQCVQEGTFRQDLLYRLEVVGIHVPPLRERIEDLPDLAYHFLKVASRRHEKEVLGISEDTIEILLTHSWPGNVRELSNVIERAIVLMNGKQITPEELPPHLAVARETFKSSPQVGARPTISVPLGTSLKDVEELMIRKTLEATSGDKNMTAKLLGINSRTIYRKLDKRPEKEAENETAPE
jgi:two-component system response regulator HydG